MESIYCHIGCDPKIMGIGPAPASRAALEKAGKTVQDMDVVEVRSDYVHPTLSYRLACSCIYM